MSQRQGKVAMNNATPRPWVVRQGDMVYSEKGRLIADCELTPLGGRPAPMSQEDAANTALIVRAVNSYDAMREALELAQAQLGDILRSSEGKDVDLEDAYTAVRAALGQAVTR